MSFFTPEDEGTRSQAIADIEAHNTQQAAVLSRLTFEKLLAHFLCFAMVHKRTFRFPPSLIGWTVEYD